MNPITIDFLKEKRNSLIENLEITKSKLNEGKIYLESWEKIFINQNAILSDLNKMIKDVKESYE